MENFHTILLPTAYLPPVHYFSYLTAAQHVLIEQNETYPKQTFRNRCEILTANGKFSLTIPVVKTFGNRTQTRDIGIFDQQNWQIVHWRTIESAYANSPYFLYYKDLLIPFYQKKYQNLLNFNMEMLMVLMEMLGLETPVTLTTSYQKNTTSFLDLREKITPKEAFTDLTFKPYYQVFGNKYGFTPGLSILDLIFNMGEEAGEILSLI